ncbi:hypothetical protein SHKM778_46840 [Streptomyces sp. KM77-8]|uniref:Uncharacterized protein n=1 Tax=Streptomyces haneummycinicus TaxID=3074435 RepID=A0AAT9HLA9_9ACTN
MPRTTIAPIPATWSMTEPGDTAFVAVKHLSGADHRAIRTALDAIAEILHRSLSPDSQAGEAEQ